MTRSALLLAIGCAALACERPVWPGPQDVPPPPPAVTASAPPLASSSSIVDASVPMKSGCGAAKLVEGRANPTIDTRPKPAKGAFHDEPNFHTCMVRVTDHVKDGLDMFSRNDYSRRQPFNADGSRFITNSRDGGWYLYDANTFERIKNLKGLAGDAEPQWDPKDPNVLYYGFRNGGLEISALDIRSDGARVVADLKGKFPWPKAARAWTKSEGSPSADGRYWAFQVETERFDILGYAVWDMAQGKLVGTMPRKIRPDHVSMSPSGRWLVSAGEDGTIAFSRDFSQQKLIRRGGEHSDLAIGPEGHDYYVSIDYQSNEGYIFMVDIDTGQRTDLIRTYINGAASAMHFSGKGFDRPGWVLMSTYRAGGPSQWYFDKVFIMELKATPRIYELAATHSDVKDAYFAEPQAATNRDFTRILFNSNWGIAGSNDVDAYMIQLPPNAFP